MAGPGVAAGRAPQGAAGAWEPNAFIRVGADNTVTVFVKHLEMGQGTFTGLPTLVAEEMDAAWAQMRVEGAPADAARYNNLFWGPVQGTGGSTAMANSYDQLRKAGAAARAMLVARGGEALERAAGFHPRRQRRRDARVRQEGDVRRAGRGGSEASPCRRTSS